MRSNQGLYYIGLPWQHQRGLALICGVGKGAKFLHLVIKEKNGEWVGFPAVHSHTSLFLLYLNRII
ncbi:hypothetical protein BHU24_00190 [Bacillus pseudomycoides]|uniref:Uncharacterized protein n=1 Tax=Bacillus pseudomycoides TaxID=64104 RepID=A0AAJ2DNB8_9BACI|nr:hypothetical protein IIW_01042 [Bacillus cereus VD136]EOP72966.1 hypothetical protein KOW_00376 [Bacillus cereus VDM006]EOQ10611.1 hypothetical protein KOY_04173 [Bacillus cereus VDM021]MBD5797010.1 hypothetical protein [Bacillus pseudomycoides]MBJ8028447.1 hypothetical protein [Bacillus cereus group sp. N21]OOG93738.1 hypothetical protein BTH41_03731 [Bacillus mycoides]